MGNFREITNVTDQSVEELRTRLGGEFKGWDPSASRKAPVKAEWKQGVHEYSAGRETNPRLLAKSTAYVNPGLRPGHIIINGVETTVEAARNAGYDVPEGKSSTGFKKPTGRSPIFGGDVQVGAYPTIQTGPKQDIEAGTDEKQSKDDAEVESDPEGRQAAAKVASETIQAIERTHGSGIVDVGLEEVADSGYIPDADQLPNGVTQAQVENIVAGYVAVADNALSAVGSSVDMLLETLTDDELREARMATIMHDTAKMHHLGQQAVNRLSMLPDRNPEVFAEMVEGMSPDERKALSQNERGDWVVTVPGRKPMGFAAAVKAGIVHV